MKYQRYPTALKLHYSAGVLPKDYCKNIPASTRHGWKTLSANSYFQGKNNECMQEHENA
jgi:hypothetical protein